MDSDDQLPNNRSHIACNDWQIWGGKCDNCNRIFGRDRWFGTISKSDVGIWTGLIVMYNYSCVGARFVVIAVTGMAERGLVLDRSCWSIA